jgi:hypothetical protein
MDRVLQADSDFFNRRKNAWEVIKLQNIELVIDKLKL